MFRRRNVILLAVGAVIFLSSAVCGYGMQAAPAPAATVDLNKPSGGGAPEATPAAAATGQPIVLPTATVAVSPTEGPVAAPPPAIPESRRVTLEFPARIKLGDSDIVRLTLEVDTLGGITPTAEIEGNTVTGQTVQIPNLYDTHNVIAEARLDLAGVDVRPGEVISEPLLPGQSVTFYWSVHPAAAGSYRGTAWLFLRFIDKQTKEETQTPISAQTLEISSADLFGMGGGLARTAGGVGSVVGAVLGFPFVGDVLKWLWRRIRHRQ